jgi:hypothetical protein
MPNQPYPVIVLVGRQSTDDIVGGSVVDNY